MDVLSEWGMGFILYMVAGGFALFAADEKFQGKIENTMSKSSVLGSFFWWGIWPLTIFLAWMWHLTTKDDDDGSGNH